MGRKLTAQEIEYLFRSSWFMDGSFRDVSFRLLIEHFCDCADKTLSPHSACLAADTEGGHSCSE